MSTILPHCLPSVSRACAANALRHGLQDVHATTNFEPTIFTTTPFIALSPSRGVLASKFLEAKNRANLVLLEEGAAVGIGEWHDETLLGRTPKFQQGADPRSSCWPLRTRSRWKAPPRCRRPHFAWFLLKLRVQYPAIEELDGSTSSSNSIGSFAAVLSRDSRALVSE